MFIRIKPTANPNKKKVQICESVRQGAKVKQVIVRHVGIAHDEKELESLKKLGKVLISKILEERSGPFLFPIEELEEADKHLEEQLDKPLAVVSETKITESKSAHR